MYIIFKLAKSFQPSIIYIKDIENWFGKKATKKRKIPAPKCQKFKKDLLAQINKHLERNDKVVVIGTTSKPWYMNQNDAKKIFYKKFYFPFPDYSSRMAIIKHFIVE
jgi:SpoVK/Ycf46/Vps4 family AAA+-type ATPase